MNKQTIKLFPCELDGVVNAPPSKSISHRAIIAAALSEGKSVISNLIYSEDIKATIQALKELGAKFKQEGDKLTVWGSKELRYSHKPVDCNESGSTLRFLIPIFSLTGDKIKFIGKESLLARPQDIYKDIFISDGNYFLNSKDSIVVNGSIKPRVYHISGDISSQFISGLLFSLPLLNGNSEIILKTKLESEGYINLTIDVLSSFGINIVTTANGYSIEGNQSYEACDYLVGGDFSQSAFYLVAGLISKRVYVNNLDINSLQGDKLIINFIKAMHGKMIFMENGFTTVNSKTSGVIIDISQTPDLAPPIALLAALSKGQTRIIKASRLRIKESDRIKSIVNTLSAIGADIKEDNDTIIIHGVDMFKGGVTVDSHNDHRIAMMVSIASSRSESPIILNGSNAVNKSYPTFFKDFKSLGGNYKNLKDWWYENN